MWQRIETRTHSLDEMPEASENDCVQQIVGWSPVSLYMRAQRHEPHHDHVLSATTSEN